MADPLRLRVMKALTTLIATARQDSNSGPDLAVFRGRNFFGATDPVPMVVILESPVQPDQIEPPEESPVAAGLWSLALQGFCEDDKDNPTDEAYVLAADVVAVIAAEKARFQGLSRVEAAQAPLLGVTANGKPAVLDILLGKPVCRPPDEVSAKAYFWLPLDIRLAENLERPYD